MSLALASCFSYALACLFEVGSEIEVSLLSAFFYIFEIYYLICNC